MSSLVAEDRFQQSVINDYRIVCRDGEVWYNRWPLTRLSPVLKATLAGDPSAHQLESQETMTTVQQVLKCYEDEQAECYSRDAYILAHKWGCITVRDRIADKFDVASVHPDDMLMFAEFGSTVVLDRIVEKYMIAAFPQNTQLGKLIEYLINKLRRTVSISSTGAVYNGSTGNNELLTLNRTGTIPNVTLLHHRSP